MWKGTITIAALALCLAAGVALTPKVAQWREEYVARKALERAGQVASRSIAGAFSGIGEFLAVVTWFKGPTVQLHAINTEGKGDKEPGGVSVVGKTPPRLAGN